MRRNVLIAEVIRIHKMQGDIALHFILNSPFSELCSHPTSLYKYKLHE